MKVRIDGNGTGHGLMKSILLGTAILIFFSYSSWAALSIDTTPHLPPDEVHPSLYFSSEDIPSLRPRIESAPYADWWSSLSWQAASYLGQDLSLSSLTEENRSKGAKACAFAYIITGQEAYAAKAKEALLAMWANSSSRRMLEASYHLQNYCEAYDWIQSKLGSADNLVVRGKLAKEAERFYDSFELSLPFGYFNNKGVKAAAALGTAAVTISHYSSASHSPTQWLSRALGRINSTLANTTTDDGLWKEGHHYLIYTCGNLIPFLWHYRNVSEVDLFDDLHPLFDFALAARFPDGRLPNIEDSYASLFPHDMVAPAYLDGNASLHMWAYESHPSFDTVWWTQDVKEADETIPPAPPEEGPSLFFPETGVAVLRSDWSSDGSYLYLNGAPDYNSMSLGGVHTHPDPLEVLLHARGEFLLHDAGYGPDGYDDDNKSWYTSDEAHNVILVNGSAPQNATVTMKSQVASEHLSLARMVAGYNGATVSRSALLVGDRYALIADHISAKAGASCELILHGRGTLALQDHSAVWTCGGAGTEQIELRASLFPGTTSIEEKTGLACFAWGEEEATSYIVSHTVGNDVTFLTVLAPVLAGDDSPAVTEISGDGCTGAVIDDDLVLAQGNSGVVSLEGLQTDASLAFVRRDEAGISLWLMENGHTLAWEGIPIVESSQRISVTGDLLSENQYQLHISPNEFAYDLFVSLPDSLWAGEISHNGVIVPGEQENDGMAIPLQGGGSVLIDLSLAAKGDVVHDGVLNIFDMIRTIHFILGSDPEASRYEKWAADVNYDGTIDILDLFDIATLVLSTP